VVTLTVNLSEAVTVAGGTPTLTPNDGGTAIYTGGSGSNALTFSYTVGAGQNTADLTVTAVNLGTATVKDGAGNAANLTGAETNPAGTLQIDTAGASVSSLVASGTGIAAGEGDLAAGKAAVKDGAGNAANLTGAVTNPAGTLQIDTTTPSVSSTHITQVGNGYFLYDGSNSGPSLKYGGAAVTAGEFGGWTPIGVEQTASGYDVVWKMSGADQYTVWSTDSSGNYTANITAVVSGSSSALESLETTFHQDLNGDGVVFTSGSGNALGAGHLVVGAGATVDLTGAYSGAITFAAASGTLAIDNSANFSGKSPGSLRPET
jgi:large repetitive protein